MDTNEEIIRIGNMRRTAEAPVAEDFYLGSGNSGALFDPYGATDSQSDRGFMHEDFYVHSPVWGRDFHVKPLKLVWRGGAAKETFVSYDQRLDIYDALLTTVLRTAAGGTIEAAAAFSPEHRDAVLLRWQWSGGAPGLCPAFVPVPPYGLSYGSTAEGSFGAVRACGTNGCEIPLLGGVSAGTAFLTVSGSASLECGNGFAAVRLSGETGSAEAILVFGKDGRRAELLAERDALLAGDAFTLAREAWHRRWGGARLSFTGREGLLRLFWVGMYHLLCSHSVSDRTISPPMGWAGVAWTFHFPQDFEYVVPVLLRMGHADIVRAKVELYKRYIPAMEEYTSRTWGAKGTMWAWEFPIGDGFGLDPGKAPNVYQHEIHNAAYPARIAWETALQSDAEWGRENALPVILSSAAFFASLLRKEGKTWGIDAVPAMSQDEFGGYNRKNYLCALYSAKYALQTAIAAAERWHCDAPDLSLWKTILADGLAFDRLEHPSGVYMIYEADPAEYALGQMKHPVPLNPISYLPVGPLNEWEKNAYRRRYELTKDAEKPMFYGWTLPDILLCAARLGDKAGFDEAAGLLLRSGNVNESLTAVYETCGALSQYPYVTSEGLLCSAILEGALCDYWGDVRENAAGYENLSFRELRLLDGTAVSRK